MKNNGRKKVVRQESMAPEQQLMLAAMLDAQATLHDALMNAGISVMASMLEQERTKLCGRRYEHDRSPLAESGFPTTGDRFDCGPIEV